MSAYKKKGIRVDFEKIQKIYALMDKALRDSNMKVTGPELFAACYFIIRTLEQAGEHKVQVERGVK